MHTLRASITTEETRDTYICFENLIQSVVGNKQWKGGKHCNLISDFVTVNQESLALWILQNYEDPWNSQKNTPARAKFTGTRNGNSMFHGWSDEGIVEYNRLCTHVVNDRNKHLNFEQEFRKEMYDK